MSSSTSVLPSLYRQLISFHSRIAIRHCHTSSRKCPVGIIGAPFDKGQRKSGASLAPRALRDSGLVTNLEYHGFNVKDYGDVAFDLIADGHTIAGSHHLKNVIGFNQLLSQKVSSIIKDGRMCLTLGGDHSIGVGTVHGALTANRDTSVLWIDAHADINTPLTSQTGNVHGMPVSFCLKEMVEYHCKLPGLDWHEPMLSARNIAFIGLRDVDPYERLLIEKLGICALSMDEVHSMGVGEALKHALSIIDPDNERHIHVSFDIDALDPLEAPSTGTPVRGGLTLREGTQILRSVQRTGRLTSVDIVEVNPLLGSAADAAATFDAARHLAAAAAGYYPGGFRPIRVHSIPRPSP